MSERMFPIGIQTFEKIRDEHYAYVDKSTHVFRLTHSGKYYFLSRPRRFGKSLLISTLEAYFEGRHDLFEGLAIETLEKEWKAYPVFHLDLTGVNYHEPDALHNLLDNALKRWENHAGIAPSPNDVLGIRFMNVIEAIATKQNCPVVLLVDEYEKPILDTLDDEELQEKHRQTLNGFYGGIKKADRFLKFVLLTGVTKIGKLSVFSALNNLTDISLMQEFSDICGITETELENNFHDDIQAFADARNKSYDAMHAELKREYNGYHFCDKMTESVYNPFSLLKALAFKQIYHFWFESGTPTFLVKLLKKTRPNIDALEGATVERDALMSIDTFKENPLPILYQSGYLTISGYDERFSEFMLDYPNAEVKEGFLKKLLPLAMGDTQSTEFNISYFVKAVEKGDTNAFFQRIDALLTHVPYEIKLNYEVHFQNFIYLLFTLMGFYTHAEYHTSSGRANVVIKTDQYIYIMELKRDGNAEDAMKQIKEKGYAKPFTADGRQIILVAANFKSDMSGLDGLIVE